MAFANKLSRNDAAIRCEQNSSRLVIVSNETQLHLNSTLFKLRSEQRMAYWIEVKRMKLDKWTCIDNTPAEIGNHQ